jgi:trimeric autotransporter adhesin
MSTGTARNTVCALIFFSVLLAFSGSVFAQEGLSPQIISPIVETDLVVLKGNTHPLARPEFDHGSAPADLPLNRMLLVLRHTPTQEATLQKFLDRLQQKSSFDFHAWLTPEQFGQQFGPSEQDIQTIESWLASHGFQVNRVAKGRGAIEFFRAGTAVQLKDAFHTEIRKYQIGQDEYWANASDPKIPSALAPVIGGIASGRCLHKACFLENVPRTR